MCDVKMYMCVTLGRRNEQVGCLCKRLLSQLHSFFSYIRFSDLFITAGVNQQFL